MILPADVRRYLHEVLGVTTSEIRRWAREHELPYFLRDHFDFKELELYGLLVILAISRADQRHSLGDVRKWLDRVVAIAEQPVVFVTATLASYERRRLIEQKIPFIVPGNQLYLPDLGLDLREHFRLRPPTVEGSLSPSAQAMLIAALLRQPWQSEWQASAVGISLGYTPMTVSRAVRELTAAGLATAHTADRSRWLRMERAPRQIWEVAKPMLRTPVKRTVWVHSDATLGSPLAGLSALAHYSMLSDPEWPVYAVGPAQWKSSVDAGVRVLPEAVTGAHEWQLWCYCPAIVPSAGTVDPLSLLLSLQDDPDDRVQVALDDLKAQLPW